MDRSATTERWLSTIFAFTRVAVSGLLSLTYTLLKVCCHAGRHLQYMYTHLSSIPAQLSLYLALIDVVRSEEKLPVEVGLINGVEIHHLDILESGKHQVFQQLTA